MMELLMVGPRQEESEQSSHHVWRKQKPNKITKFDLLLNYSHTAYLLIYSRKLSCQRPMQVWFRSLRWKIGSEPPKITSVFVSFQRQRTWDFSSNSPLGCILQIQKLGERWHKGKISVSISETLVLLGDGGELLLPVWPAGHTQYLF